MQAAVPDARVAAAFQHVPAAALSDLDHPVESDVLVCADDDGARATVLGLVAEIPNLRGFDGGSLANAIGIETFAALLLTINLRHHGKASLRLIGVEPSPPEDA
jgi:predicted dinucleotide-binding enzyme